MQKSQKPPSQKPPSQKPPRLVMLARVPEYGQVKSRLAKHIGQPQALRAHVQLLRLNIAVAAKACAEFSGQPLELHFAGDAQQPFFATLARQYDALLVPQVAGDIGVRMLAAAGEAQGSQAPCLIIGSDCGALSVAYLAKSAELLSTHDAVLGSAEDGGYVLIGMRERRPELFEDIDWGTAKVSEQTRERAREAGIDAAELDVQWDVDTVQDWRRFTKVQSEAFLGRKLS